MKHILVADDCNDLLTLASIFLSRAGYVVQTANSTEEIFKKLADFRISILLLDIRFHGFDGRQLCNQIKNNDITKNIINCHTRLNRHAEAIIAPSDPKQNHIATSCIVVISTIAKTTSATSHIITISTGI